MKKWRVLGVLVTITAGPGVAVLAQSPRTVESILAEVEAMRPVEFDKARRADPKYPAEYRALVRQQAVKKSALLLEACRLAPKDPRVEDWMPRRWQSLTWNQEPLEVGDEVLADIDKHLPEFSRPKIVQEADYYRAFFRAHKLKPDAAKMMESVSPFVTAYPADFRGASLLQIVADSASGNDELLKTIFRKQAADYPGTHVGKFAAGRLRRVEGIGKPFALTFEDAISGKKVSIEDLRGKVVLLNFWATTCPGCIDEVPTLRELSAKFGGMGLQVIGVSMDQPESKGGLKSLRDFVAKRGITWPQYYQGAGHDSDFSKSWGISSTPTKFLIDREGKLVGVVPAEELELRLAALLRG